MLLIYTNGKLNCTSSQEVTLAAAYHSDYASSSKIVYVESNAQIALNK